MPGMEKLDLQSISQAVDLRRMELDLSWGEVAAAVGAPVEELRSIGDGGDAHMSVVMRTIAWTGLGIEAFLEEDGDKPAESAEKAGHVAAFLRADRHLKPESAEAIEAVLRAAYDRFASPA
jgi:hypothetical protein